MVKGVEYITGENPVLEVRGILTRNGEDYDIVSILEIGCGSYTTFTNDLC